ncbi:MAG: WYL domain-containing protein [Leucobacter sp.]
MHKSVLAPDRVLLLLSLVPYLREHGPTPVPELAAAFSVPPETLRGLVRFLGTAGVPGETLSYQHEDLFDIDWDALEQQDVVSLTRTVAVDEPPRFSPVETAALIAGLHALQPLLPPDAAEVAERTAAKLGGALGGGAATGRRSLSVTAGPEDPRLPVIVGALDAERVLAFEYRDASGAASARRVEPLSLQQEGGAWYLRGFCLGRGAERTFRVDRMGEPRMLGIAAQRRDPEARRTDPGGDAAAITEITVLATERGLARIAGFEPRTIGIADGRVRARVDAWHSGTAVRLVQQAPGEVVVEGPAEARSAVREWAERALSASGE